MEEGVGRNVAVPRPWHQSPRSRPFPASPEFVLRRLSLCVLLSRRWDPPPHHRDGEEVRNRLAAPRIGEVLDLEPVITSPSLPPHLRPLNLLLGLPVGAVLEEVLHCLGTVKVPLRVLAGEAVAYLQLVNP